MKSKTDKKAGESLAFAAAILLAVSGANAETWWEGDAPDASNGNTYWEDSGNWYNGFSTPAHFVRRNFTEGRSRTVSFRSANEFAGYLVFGNDNASETQCDAGAVVFQADSATAGFKITNSETIYIGAGDGEGSIKVESGTYNAQYWVVGQGKTASVEVTGGMVTSRGSAYVGQKNGSAGTLTVSDGGVFVCGEGTIETQLQLSQDTGSTGTININEGGTLVTAHIQPGTGTPIVNFNGGTLKLNYGGTVFGSRDNFTNYVNAAGGTLDTAGFETYVKALIKGEGTLKITGGGTVRFDNSGVKPECPIYVEEGVVFLTSAMTPTSIRIGKNGFIRYDLVSITDTSAEDQTLAEGVTITMDEGETLAEHVLIRNNGTLMWQAYLDGTTLKARNMTGKTADTTIWTGYKGDNWFTYVQNWTCGVPSSSTKVVFPYAATVNQGTVDLDCGDIVLKTDGKVTIQNGANVTRAYHFWAHEISGSGSLELSVNYLETDNGSDMDINVPVVFTANAYGTYMQGRGGRSVNINAPMTVDTQANGCTVQGGVAINGDLTVTANSTLTFSGTQTLKGVIEGAGTIAGSFTTAGGAVLKSTASADGGVYSATCLTVEGNADLSNATVEIEGGEALADAGASTEIILLKATGTITWPASVKYVIPGQKYVWTITTGTTTVDATTYKTLKAVRTACGFMIIIAGETEATLEDQEFGEWVNEVDYTPASGYFSDKNGNGLSPIVAYMLGYPTYDDESAATLEATNDGDGFTLNLVAEGETKYVKGYMLKTSIEQSSDLENWTVVDGTTSQGTSAKLLLASVGSAPYFRLTADLLAASTSQE